MCFWDAAASQPTNIYVYMVNVLESNRCMRECMSFQCVCHVNVYRTLLLGAACEQHITLNAPRDLLISCDWHVTHGTLKCFCCCCCCISIHFNKLLQTEFFCLLVSFWQMIERCLTVLRLAVYSVSRSCGINIYKKNGMHMWFKSQHNSISHHPVKALNIHIIYTLHLLYIDRMCEWENGGGGVARWCNARFSSALNLGLIVCCSPNTCTEWWSLGVTLSLLWSL